MKKTLLVLLAALSLPFMGTAQAITPSPTASPSATPTPSPIPVSPDFTLAWDANPASDNVTKYIVSSGPVSRTGTSFVYPNNVDVTSGTTYAFKAQPVGKLYVAVRAVNSGGTSAYSAEMPLVVQQGSPTVPNNLRITITGLVLNLTPTGSGGYALTINTQKKGSIQITP